MERGLGIVQQFPAFPPRTTARRRRTRRPSKTLRGRVGSPSPHQLTGLETAAPGMFFGNCAARSMAV